MVKYFKALCLSLLLFAGAMWLNTAHAANTFQLDKKYYPSTANPDFLPNGTLVKSPASPNIFYLQSGKKSWVLPGLAARWFTENHFFKQDIVLTISAADLARYPQGASVNPVYVGKVLQAPNGTQYFIDDKLRKREVSAKVRAALKMPTGNLYPTSAAHLAEFKTGPALLTNQYPGGFVVYTGAYHGGQMWQISEITGGKLVKRLYLSDYLYEASYNPDETLRAAAVPAIFARYPRGLNIERYPDGWIVGLKSKIFVVQGGKLRQIANPQLFAALGYSSKHVLTKFPEFLRRYPQGYPIAAFKNITSKVTASAVPQAAPNAAHALVKVRPAIRALIADINNIYMSVYDKEPTAGENKFWVNYVYNGETNNRADLIAIMTTAAKSDRHPALTARTAAIDLEKLSSQWFSYLFYFVHQSEPSAADRAYWLGRINGHDLNTIEKIGGALQWVKENLNATRR